MERPNAWKDYTAEQLDELHYLCEGYKAYISDNKTERECCAAAVSLAEEAGYVDLAAKIAAGEALKPGEIVVSRRTTPRPRVRSSSSLIMAAASLCPRSCSSTATCQRKSVSGDWGRTKAVAKPPTRPSTSVTIEVPAKSRHHIT